MSKETCLNSRKNYDEFPVIIGSCVAFVAFSAIPKRFSFLKNNRVPGTFWGGFKEGVGSVRLWSAAVLGLGGWMTSQKLVSREAHNGR